MAVTESRSRSLSPKAITAIVVGLLALVFAFQNADEKHVRFLAWSWSMPAWIWLVVIFAAGVVVGSVFPWLRRRRY